MYSFQDTASYLSKVAEFSSPHVSGYPNGISPMSLVSENYDPRLSCNIV